MQRALGRRARLAASSGVARHRPGAGRAGISWGLLILLLAVLAIFWLGYTLSKQSETADLHAAQDAMSEPETMLARFFVARGQDYELSDVRWQELLAYMSRDDQQWFNQNLAALVDLARKASFAPSKAPSTRTGG